MLSGNILPTKAAEITTSDITAENVEYFADGSYLVTSIETFNKNEISLFSTSANRSGSKTATYKSSNDSSLWSVTVTGTFTYGSTTKCTSSSVSATSYSSSWKVSYKTSSKSGNTARACAKYIMHYTILPVTSTTEVVTLSCYSKGVLS